MRRVVFNQKGGVGKTTIVCNLAAIAASRGLRTLVLDLDSQCNATQYLLGDLAGSSEGTIGDFFEGTLSFSLQSRGLEPLDPCCFNSLLCAGGFAIPARPSGQSTDWML